MLKYPYTRNAGGTKSKSVGRKDSQGTSQIMINERVGSMKSPSTGALGRKRTKKKTKKRAKSKAKSTRSASTRPITGNAKGYPFIDVQAAGGEQNEQVNKLMANWEQEYYHMMGGKYKPNTSKRGTRKTKSRSSKRAIKK
jgi:hypothetical protein